MARQRVAKHIPAEANSWSNRISVDRQRRCKQALSTIQDVFPMDPSRDYISSPVVNQKSVVERKRELGESSAVKEEGLG
jgi:hypothetical protein